MKSICGARLQNGIFYHAESFHSFSRYRKNKNALTNESLALVFLKIAKDSKACTVRDSIQKLWKMYSALKQGRLSDIQNRRVPPGGLTVLIGYSPNIFKVPGIKKHIPLAMKDRQFSRPIGNHDIANGSGLKYAKNYHENLGLSHDIVIQLISKTQLATYRAVVETWKQLKYDGLKEYPLRFSRYFTGFHRDDGRSWLGFHDDISNMANPKERVDAISIDISNNGLIHRDFWTKGGTYLAYLRIEIDLNIWLGIELKQQELFVGRDKLNGYPLIGVDKQGRPVHYPYMPMRKVKHYEDYFRDHPDYFKMPRASNKLFAKLDVPASIKILNKSHVGRTRHIDGLSSRDPASRRIYRQSFEFLEPVNSIPTKPFRVGLNFISFQNDPGRLFFILTNPNWLGKTNFGGDRHNKKMTNFLRVLAAGIFFVPPAEKPFPGVSIFN